MENEAIKLSYYPDVQNIRHSIPVRDSALTKGKYAYCTAIHQYIIHDNDTISFRIGSTSGIRGFYVDIPLHVHSDRYGEYVFDISKCDPSYNESVLSDFEHVTDTTSTIAISQWNNGELLTLNDLLYVPCGENTNSIDMPRYKYSHFFFLNKGLSFHIDKTRHNPFIFKSNPYPGVEVAVSFDALDTMVVKYDVVDMGTFQDYYSISGDLNKLRVGKLIHSTRPQAVHGATKGIFPYDPLALQGRRINFASRDFNPLEYMIINNTLYVNQINVPEIKAMIFDVNKDRKIIIDYDGYSDIYTLDRTDD